MTLGLEKRMPLHSGDFRFQNIFGREICGELPLQSGILCASPEVMHRPCGASINLNPFFVFFLTLRACYRVVKNAIARHLLSAAMLERWPQVCRVKITLERLRKNWFLYTQTDSTKCFVGFF